MGVSKSIHIGEILVEQGVLNPQQVLEITQAQRSQGIPFGVLAERMFEVALESVERAWIEQYRRLTGVIDLSQQTIDPEVLAVVNRRQAWQFEMMPLHYGKDGELLIAATNHRLARAVTFVVNRLGPIAYFRIAEPDQLRQCLQRYYPMPEISQDLKNRVRNLAWATPGTKPA